MYAILLTKYCAYDTICIRYDTYAYAMQIESTVIDYIFVLDSTYHIVSSKCYDKCHKWNEALRGYYDTT